MNFYHIVPYIHSSPSWQNGSHFRRWHFSMHFLKWHSYNSNSNFTEICSQESNDNKPAVVQVMAWRQIGDKPLPEPMMAQFTDAYMRH